MSPKILIFRVIPNLSGLFIAVETGVRTETVNRVTLYMAPKYRSGHRTTRVS